MSEPVAPDDIPMSGAIPVGAGVGSVVRIPVPGTNGLALEFSPRGYVPKNGSTTTLFFQNIDGKRHLRLDFGFNKATQSVNYHWNQKGTFSQFGIADHTSAGPEGRALYQSAKYYRYFGRVFIVYGLASDLLSIVQASNPIRRTAQVMSAWAVAGVGCKVVGAAGAGYGTTVVVLPVWGTALGGIGGCIIGGVGGYWAGEKISGYLYDWAADSFFSQLPSVPAP